jgi:hypothetical protein
MLFAMRPSTPLLCALLAACSDGSAAGPDASPQADARVVADADIATLCSADLRNVLNEYGAVIQECAADEGCHAGECIAACDAAAASRGNIGCDFKAATPYYFIHYHTPCFVVFITNTWPTSAELSIRRNSQLYDVSEFGRIPVAGAPESEWPAIPDTGIPPGEVGVLFLSDSPSTNRRCPVTPALVGDDAAVEGSGTSAAWEITSSAPVSAYDVLPYGGAGSLLPSAQLLFPTSAWGDNFIAVQPMPSNRKKDDGTLLGGPGWAQIVASEDATTIDLVPNVDLPAAGSIPATAAGTPLTFSLGAGEVVQWELPRWTDLSGSVIASDKPISYVGGDSYICYDSSTADQGGCDSAHQGVPPISALGSDYIAAPFPDRGDTPESIWYRIVGAVDGTVLTYDPPISNGPTSLSQGQVIDFESTRPFRVRSQDSDHAFYLAQTMPGCDRIEYTVCKGDEDFVMVLPAAQYLSRYVFFSEPSYATTQFVFVREKVGDSFADVELDCLGTISGWTAVDESGDFEMARVTISLDGEPVDGCSNGRHEAVSTQPFGLTVWGTDFFSSYAYPAGGNVSSINQIVIDPID